MTPNAPDRPPIADSPANPAAADPWAKAAVANPSVQAAATDPSTEGAALPERQASLWLLTGGPATWAAHFLLSYVTVAVWCAKAAAPDAPLGSARVALAVYTVIAFGLIAWFGWQGFGKHRWGTATLPHDAGTPGDRHRFLGFATLLLSGLSFVAVVYTTLAMVVIGTCR